MHVALRVARFCDSVIGGGGVIGDLSGSVLKNPNPLARRAVGTSDSPSCVTPPAFQPRAGLGANHLRPVRIVGDPRHGDGPRYGRKMIAMSDND